MTDFADILAREIVRLQADVVDTMQANDQRATGKSIAAVRSDSGEEYARLFGPAHAKQLRDGRRPGQRPPIEAIKEWLAAKRLTLNPYAVANSIAKKGTQLWRGEDARFKKPTDTFSGPIAAALPRFRAGLVDAARSGLRSDLVAFTANRL
ncbi:hypothetical protein QMK33_19765 [Hymenobacter sp. H14-R3]|uniref:hypothetical protein n=1 Tax=Hymenobacter sp. H14-R3 TaxID=3046308 RepID=UPI0024BB9810|nr:hypothetical protein [Hymenobacter sp. H14-R3]MDJ0367392.1 hypothetical protein [Hymenobacter sp. H14-R3]